MGGTTADVEMAESRHRPGSLSRDSVLEVLSNERRRHVMHYLKHNLGVDDGGIGVRELAEHVAAWENGKSVAAIDYRERKRVQNALRQFHLPKMADHGFVEYDSRSGTVGLTSAAAEHDFYVDVLPTRGIPWGLYYLGFSAVMLVVLSAALLDVAPFDALSALEWCVFFATVLLASSVGHFYDNYYRMRLGARETPPEVE